jgi:hypothetical protein
VYLGNELETYFIAGGTDPKSGKSSKSAYLLEKNVLSQVRDMRRARINFAMATLIESKRITQQIVNVYCIGGYSVKEGRAMKEVERYSMEAKDWVHVADMNIARINPGACSTGQRYIYVFGGRSQGEEFYDTIERYNVDLNLWSVLRVTMPVGLCNLHCFTFLKEDRIVILGGLKRKVTKNKMQAAIEAHQSGGDSEIDKNVYMFNTFREVWYKLRPLDTEHGDLKVSHAVSAPESKGKIYLFKINPKSKLGNFPEV